jgi:predicted TIM-barrel fold metal-dependent hydrolase
MIIKKAVKKLQIMSKLNETGRNATPDLPRREFLTRSALWFAGAVVAANAGTPKLFAKETGKQEKLTGADPFQVFDCHLHCPPANGERWQWYKVTSSFEDFVSYLDKTGVQKGIINSQRSFGTKPEEFIAGNREVAGYVEKYKGRFLGACVVNPQYIEESLREIEYCHNQLGFVWVGELCNYMVPYLYSIREFGMLVEQVVKLNMVLALHTERGELEYVAQKFPRATIAFAHFGDDHEYEYIFKRIDMVAQNPIFYLDTSGYGHDRVGVLEYAIKTIGPDRILFGSDFSINDPGTVIARIRNSFLTQEQKQKILSGNLLELLKKVQKA